MQQCTCVHMKSMIHNLGVVNCHRTKVTNLLFVVHLSKQPHIVLSELPTQFQKTSPIILSKSVDTRCKFSLPSALMTKTMVLAIIVNSHEYVTPYEFVRNQGPDQRNCIHHCARTRVHKAPSQRWQCHLNIAIFAENFESVPEPCSRICIQACGN